MTDVLSLIVVVWHLPPLLCCCLDITNGGGKLVFLRPALLMNVIWKVGINAI